MNYLMPWPRPPKPKKAQKQMKRTPLKKSPSAHSKRSFIRKRSKKGRAEDAVYKVRVLAFKKANPNCKRCGVSWENAILDCHHVHGRGINYLNEETWVSLCRACHRWVHDNPGEARAAGLLA